jgi:murein DD-endopeptidase MepM/ murein hydrolase activator NlpD
MSIDGERVQALMAGRVVAVVIDQPPYGNMVIIETPHSFLPPEVISQFEISQGSSIFTLYAHFKNKPFVVLGEQVSCGQHLGEVGTTGYNIVNPHLHIETRIGPSESKFEEGMAYYDTRTTEAERSNYELWRTSGVFRHFDPVALISYYIDQILDLQLTK